MLYLGPANNWTEHIVIGSFCFNRVIWVPMHRQWTVLELLVEEVRPHVEAPLSHLCRTMSTILYRYNFGAKLRNMLAEHGPWWIVAQTFIRWTHLAV